MCDKIREGHFNKWIIYIYYTRIAIMIGYLKKYAIKFEEGIFDKTLFTFIIYIYDY